MTTSPLCLGTDIVDVPRIRRVHQRHGERFLERTFTGEEQNYCLQARDPAERLAVRWAAKEAVMKALGTGWTQGVRFADIEVTRNADGAPGILLHGQAQQRAKQRGIDTWLVSLSHTNEYATATVIGMK